MTEVLGSIRHGVRRDVRSYRCAWGSNYPFVTATSSNRGANDSIDVDRDIALPVIFDCNTVPACSEASTSAGDSDSDSESLAITPSPGRGLARRRGHHADHGTPSR